MASKNSKLLGTIFFLSLFFSITLNVSKVFADTVKELNSQIDSYTSKINQIDKEIEEQRKLIQTTSAKAGEIQAQINALTATKKKLQSDITRTQNVIEKSELTIQKIDIELTDKQRTIQKTQRGLSQSMRELYVLGETSLIDFFLDSDTISDFFSQITQVQRFKESLINKKYELLDLNRQLAEQKTDEQKTKEELEKEKLILAAQQDTVLSTEKSKSGLLSATKSEQSKYEELLKEKQKQRQEFDALVRDIESKIKILVDPTSYPSAKNSILSWPLDKIIVTQEFGGSDFAKNNPGIYGRPYHPGTDFGAPIGTKIKSVSSGTVKGFDNTDAYPGCYAWGRWLLIEHDNGLSSLYPHLSSILVSVGQRVESGEVIALSGNTGISTGPHLHLSLYASQGVKIGKYGTYKPGGSGCAATNATGPFADLSAYLDPMDYLPSL